MKIAIADDHNLVREGLAAVLAQIEDVTDVIEAGSLDELMVGLADHPDVGLVLLDLKMPGMNDITTLVQLQDAYPTAPFAILSATEVKAVAQRFLDVGAAGYIPKSVNNEVLLSAIKLIISGGIYVPSIASGHIGTDPGESSLNLTDRQHDVLVLMVEGLSNKGIARVLGLTESTIKTHSSAILKALGVNNRMKAIREAIRLGIVESP